MIDEKTSLEIFGCTRDTLIRQASAHTQAVQAWLSSRSPHAMRHEGIGTLATSTGLKVPLLNLCLGSHFPPNTGVETIEKEIEEVRSFFAKRGVPWYWWMEANPSPANIGEILTRHGLIRDAPPLPAMIASLSGREEHLLKSDGSIRVWRAKSRMDLQAASLIRRTAFKFPPNEAVTYFEDMEADWLRDESPARLFLAGKSYSKPVSIGAVIEGAGLPGIYVMATLPVDHRKGFGKAILSRLLAEASKGRHDMLVLTASTSGFPLYSQFGFRHLFDFDLYRPISAA